MESCTELFWCAGEFVEERFNLKKGGGSVRGLIVGKFVVLNGLWCSVETGIGGAATVGGRGMLSCTSGEI